MPSFWKLLSDAKKAKLRVPYMQGILVIAALGVIDLVEIILDFLAVGFALNPIIDVGTGFGLWIFFKLKGIKFTENALQGIFFFGSMVVEGIGDGTLPLWCLDGIVTTGISWAEDIARETAEKAALAAEAAQTNQAIAASNVTQLNAQKASNVTRLSREGTKKLAA